LADTDFAGTLAGYKSSMDRPTGLINATTGAKFNGFNAGAGSVPADLATVLCRSNDKSSTAWILAGSRPGAAQVD